MKYPIKKLFSSLRLYTLSFISGVLMGLTVAPVGAWFLAWIALAPLWVLVVKHSTQLEDKRRKFYLLPLFWGIGYHGLALFWITGIHPMNWLGVPWLASLAITVFCWTFVTLWGAAIVVAWAALMVRLAVSKPVLRVLIGTAIWCLLEGIWSAGALWWSSLSYTQSPQNLVILHLGQLAGPSAITAAIVAVNGFIAEAWINRKTSSSASSAPWRFVNQYFLLATLLFITLHLIGCSFYSVPLSKTPETALKVGIVQGNIPNIIKLKPEGLRRAIAGYTNGYLTLADRGVDAVLTPE